MAGKEIRHYAALAFYLFIYFYTALKKAA